MGWLLLWEIAPNDVSCSSAISMLWLLRWPWKRALICFLDKKPSVDALMASRIRSAVWSPVAVPNKREALAAQ